MVKVQLFVMYLITPDRGGAHKLISFIVFLHVLKASAWNGSKKQKVVVFMPTFVVEPRTPMGKLINEIRISGIIFATRWLM